MKLLKVESETYGTHVSINLDEVYAIEAIESDGSYCVVAYIKNSNMEDDEFYIISGDYVANHDSENESMERDILAFYKAIVNFWCNNDKVKVIDDTEATMYLMR